MKIEKSWCERGQNGDWCGIAIFYGDKGCSCCTTRLKFRWSPTRFRLGFSISIMKGHADIYLAIWGDVNFVYVKEEKK